MTLPIFQRTITDLQGDVLASATVDVFKESDGTRPTLYSDRDGNNTISNPVTADSEGFVQFYVAAGDYKIIATSGGNTRTWRYVGIWSPGSDSFNTFESLSDAVSAVNAGDVDVGVRVETLSYYGGWTAAAGDPKGGNVYELVDAGSAGARPTEDNGSVIHCTGGSGGLYLKGLFPNSIWIEQFGCGDGNPDDTRLRNALNYGPCNAGPGQFNLTVFELASNDELYGSGSQTVFNSAGVTFAFGVIDAGAFTGGNATYSLATAPSYGDRSITMVTAADAGNYSVGEILALWSDDGYTDGLGTFKPKFQQLVSVKSVDAGTGLVELDEAIYQNPTGTEFRVSKGSELTNSEGVANGLTRDIVLSNFAVNVSGNDSWTRFGGTYNTLIENIYTQKTNGIFVNNGFAKSRAINLYGNFEQRVSDLAYFSHDSRLEFGPCSHTGETNTKNPYTFAEGAHDNEFINQSVHYQNESTVIPKIFAMTPGSQRNKLSGGTITAGAVEEMIWCDNQEGSDVIPFRDNVLSNIRIKCLSAQKVVRTNALSPSSEAGLTITDSVTLEAETITQDLFEIQASGFRCRGALIRNGQASSVTVISGVENYEIVDNRFQLWPTWSLADDAYGDADGNTFDADSLYNADTTALSGAGISATSPTAVLERTFPTATLVDDDCVRVKAWLNVVGTTADKNVALRVNGTSLAARIIPAAHTGPVEVSGVFELISPTAQRAYLSTLDSAAAAARGTAAIDSTANPLTFTLAVWVNNAADSVAPEYAEFEAVRAV